MHQDHADNRHGHGYRADDLHAVFLFGDQSEHGERPYEHEEHFIDAGERWMPGFIPAASDRAGVGDESRPGSQGRKANVRGKAGDTEGEIERSRATIENESGVEQIRVVEQVAALDHVQKCHE